MEATATERLSALAVQWQRSIKDIGALLIELQSDPNVDVLVLRMQILRDKYGMSMATSSVAMRWAKGELGDDEVASQLVSKVKATVLAAMDDKAIEATLSGEHRIRTRDGIKTMVFADMTREQVSINIGTQGFVPIGKGITKVPPLRYCEAISMEKDKRGRVVFVSSRGNELVRMMVPNNLLAEAVDEQLAPA